MEGNITATVYSLESSGDNSSEIVVTVVTNSDASPDMLTDLLTQPLDQELQEFADIDQSVLFKIIGTERFGMLCSLIHQSQYIHNAKSAFECCYVCIYCIY